MGRCQIDTPQNIRKTASGCGGVPPDHRAPDHRNRSYAIQLRTISGMLRGSGVHNRLHRGAFKIINRDPKSIEKH